MYGWAGRVRHEALMQRTCAVADRLASKSAGHVVDPVLAEMRSGSCGRGLGFHSVLGAWPGQGLVSGSSGEGRTRRNSGVVEHVLSVSAPNAWVSVLSTCAGTGLYPCELSSRQV